MNKTKIIGLIAKKANITKTDARKTVGAFIQTVEESLKQGDKVGILGFGSFVVSQKAARMGINPKTKESINIPARKVIKFKPGTSLSRVVG